ncbi:MAG: zinc carboxypeptidase [Elusimicrobia bacterium]|nr:zinc carboxypeptidase [Elusimicrobiota bacterium]
MRSPAEILIVLLCAPALSWASADAPFDGGGKPFEIDLGRMTTASRSLAAEVDDRLWVTALAPDKRSRTLASEAGFAIEEIRGGAIMGVALPETVDALKAAGIEVLAAVPLLKQFNAKDFPKEDGAYHNYAEAAALLNELAAAAPKLASAFSIGKSLLGRDIPALRLNSSARGPAPSSKPGIVFLGTHHAREHLSTEIPLLLAKHLVDNRDKPDIAALLESRDIFVIPLVNPDGSEYDIEGDRYHMHRKNMRANSDKSVGVDLNRNYGFHWCESGASSNPRSDTYCGTAAFSEPETAAVKAFLEARTNVKILLTYHTFSELILYPWGHTESPIPDAPALAAYKSMADAMAKMNGYTPQQSSDLYVASGDTTDWAWAVRGIFSFTFELSPKSLWDGGFYPGVPAIATTFAANLRPALYLIGLADDPLRAPAADAISERRPGRSGSALDRAPSVSGDGVAGEDRPVAAFGSR